jgi:ribosomal protein S18 acetylase RimI-like enzyme
MDDKIPAVPNSGSLLQTRVAASADQPRLIALINSAFSVETFLEGTRTDNERLADLMRTGSILVAENPAEEDGCASLLGCVYIEVRGQRGYLGQLAVDPAHQGSGLARRLIEAAENHLRLERCEAVDIIVLSLRPDLLPLYRRFGYIETGIEEGFRPVRKLAPGIECHGIKMSKQL